MTRPRLVLAVSLAVSLLGLASGQDAQAVYKKALPSVMTLQVKTRDGDNATGTAFLAIKDGCAVTAWHVVRDAESAVAHFADGQEFEVSGLIDKDEKRDVALLRVKVADRPLLSIAMGDPEVGSKVFVLGAPRGLEFSFTDGIISQIRSDGTSKLYQFSAETNPGNSGGPLLNSKGEVLGVISWKLRDTQNVNFAVAATYVRGLDQSLPTRPWASLPATPVASVASPVPASSLPLPVDAASAWYSGVGKALLAWNIWWGKQADPATRDSGTLVIDRCYTYCREMRDAIYADPFVRLSLLPKTLSEPMTDLSKTLGELASARTAAIIKSRFGSSAELESANEEANLQYSRVFALFSACYDTFKGEPWFSWAPFEDKLNSAVAFSFFGPILDRVIPDPALPDRCMVGFAWGSDLRAGDVIVAVREIPTSEASTQIGTGESLTKVSTWRSLKAFLLKSPSRFVEVNVGSADSPRFLRIGVVRP